MAASDTFDFQSRILEATIDLLACRGIAGVSMRAVAREAGVALGPVNHQFEDKTSLIPAALQHAGTEALAGA